MGHASNIKNILVYINALGLMLHDLRHALKAGAATLAAYKLRVQGRSE